MEGLFGMKFLLPEDVSEKDADSSEVKTYHDVHPTESILKINEFTLQISIKYVKYRGVRVFLEIIFHVWCSNAFCLWAVMQA